MYFSTQLHCASHIPELATSEFLYCEVQHDSLTKQISYTRKKDKRMK